LHLWEVVPIKPIVSYRKRRDLALKKFSALQITLLLTEQIIFSGILSKNFRGRPCEIPKERIISFILWSKIFGDGYEEMELNSELFLDRHYDHSLFQYIDIMTIVYSSIITLIYLPSR